MTPCLTQRAFPLSFLVLSAVGAGHVSAQGSANPARPVDPCLRMDLRTLVGKPIPNVVGVTVDPEDGQVYLLDADVGLFRLGAHRTELVLPAEDLYTVPMDSRFTDIAAMGKGQFALTARNDGFLLDLKRGGSLTQHFCYVPSPAPFLEQLTNSVAWNAVEDRLVVQPITILTQVWGGSWTSASEVGTFPRQGGIGTDWHPMPDIDFLSGAITCDASGDLWLVRDNELYTYDLVFDTLTYVRDLKDFGVQVVDGLAFTDSHLLVVDTPSDTLVWIPLAKL